MVSQASAADLSAASPVVSPTARLVAGTLVAMSLLSSIARHAIPGICTGAGKYVSLLTVIKGSCGQLVCCFLVADIFAPL